MAKGIVNYLPTGSPKTGLFSKLFGKKKKNNDPLAGLTRLDPPPYRGLRPYSGEDVGLGAGTLKTLADAYIPQIMGQARGEGVGFDPSRRTTLRNEFLEDFGDYETDVYRKASQQASAQGLRGGIPQSIRSDVNRGLARARQSALAGIDVEDLTAAREDRNRAIYAQPDIVNQGAGIQQNRAGFDLNEYQATLPTYIDQPPKQPSNILPALLSAAGTIGGAYFGGPGGAAAGGAAGNFLGQGFGRQDPIAPRPRRYNFADPLLTSGGYGFRRQPY